MFAQEFISRFFRMFLEMAAFIYFCYGTQKRARITAPVEIGLYVLVAALNTVIEVSLLHFTVARSCITVMVFAFLLFSLYSLDFYYSIYLAGIFVISRGIGTILLTPGVFASLGIDVYSLGIVQNGRFAMRYLFLAHTLIRFAVLAVMKRAGFRIQLARRLEGKELAILLLPPFVSYLSVRILYDVLADMGPHPDYRVAWIAVMLSMVSILGIIAVERLLENKELRQEIRMGRARMQEQYKAFRQSQMAEDDLRKIYHDMSKHMTALREMGSSAEANKHLSRIENCFKNLNLEEYTGSTIRTLLDKKRKEYEEAGIDFTYTIPTELDTLMEPLDVFSVIGNALDNAKEALDRRKDQGNGERGWIELRSIVRSGFIVIRISNPFEGTLVVEDGKLRTSKLEAGLHGHGLTIIRDIVEKYGGVVDWSEEEKVFHLKILIPAKQKEGQTP